MAERMQGLKLILISRNIKVKGLADNIGVPYPTFAGYINGFSNPPENVIQDVCKELNISRGDLYKIPDGLSNI
jgi:hypothetical protein